MRGLGDRDTQDAVLVMSFNLVLLDRDGQPDATLKLTEVALNTEVTLVAGLLPLSFACNHQLIASDLDLNVVQRNAGQVRFQQIPVFGLADIHPGPRQQGPFPRRPGAVPSDQSVEDRVHLTNW